MCTFVNTSYMYTENDKHKYNRFGGEKNTHFEKGKNSLATH